MEADTETEMTAAYWNAQPSALRSRISEGPISVDTYAAYLMDHVDVEEIKQAAFDAAKGSSIIGCEPEAGMYAKNEVPKVIADRYPALSKPVRRHISQRVKQNMQRSAEKNVRRETERRAARHSTRDRTVEPY